MLVFRCSFVLELSGSPSSSTSGLHIGHCTYNFGGVIVEGLQAEADVGPAGHEEFFALGLVTIELGRVGRFKRNLLLAGGRSRYRCGLATCRLPGWVVLFLQGQHRAHSFEEVSSRVWVASL